MSGEFLTGQTQALTKRGLSEETCAKFNYTVGEHNGKPVQIANYRREGEIVAQKVRYPDKTFSVRGKLKNAGLFGQHLWGEGGRKIVITEGELDCLSVSQVQDNKWPVVSIPNGADGAKKTVAQELEWLEKFDEVILMFDMDEPGQSAAQECALLFTPGKCKIAHLPLKDANEMLAKGKARGIIDAIWNAKVFRPDGIVTFADLRERALAPIEVGLPWFLPKLTEITFGRRYGEVYFFGAGTGVGKTDWFTQEIVNTAVTLNEKCAVFYLEQSPVETAKRIAGKLGGRRFHVPDGTWTLEELEAAFDEIQASTNVVMYDSFGATEWDVIHAKMKYLATAEGVKHFFLDHLTALAAAEEDERKALEKIMEEIASFAKQYNVCFYGISHLATPEGKPHEEGGRVMIRHFKGSRAIGFWSHYMFGLERDQQAEDETLRQITTFRVLKDRFTGQATGITILMGYETDTGRLFEREPPPMFDEEPEVSGKQDF
ncbi:toprim domain-containing protein [Luteibacter sp. ME-Dv--P-043b]|uniref:toprim domain-containing protein n=1 Tax=Luteibacter sp. ME-Dv--P-043b TaxID=3040291 RepID=UPI0025553B64|nr:toprim domain-containing protein [Luteibacter sp. ME-Dv--P-043b]